MSVLLLEQRQIGSGLVHPEPALLDGVAHASPKLRWAALELGQERPVDRLDVDAAVLNWLDTVCDLDSLRAAASGSAKGRYSTNFMLRPSSLSATRSRS
jgi:hypothetical protein